MKPKEIAKKVTGLIKHEKEEIPKLEAIKTAAEKIHGIHSEPIRYHKGGKPS